MAEAPNPGFDAIVLALGEAAHEGKVCGLTLAERGRRVAVRAGATRVHVVKDDATAKGLSPWAAQGGRDVLILRASDQVVHFPLVDAVRGGGARVAVTPDDGSYAGAIWVPAADAVDVLATLSEDPAHGDEALARRWLEAGHATAHAHGAIARHRAVTKDERKAATKMLFELVHKKDQDGLLSKYLFRPVAYPITRAFLPTFITPNMVTAIVAVLALTGCAIVTGASYEAAVIGALMQHVAGYFDCTDGEIARLRHEGSKMGMWFDTLADEATSIAYVGCIGYHVYVNHPGQWYTPYLGWAIPVAVACNLIAVYVIYYYLIKVARSGNSQEYPTNVHPKLQPLTQLLHRDFIGLFSLIMAVANLNEVLFGMMFVGSVVTAVGIVPQHVKLRRDLAAGIVVPKPA